MAFLFGAGVLFAVPVLRWNIRPLLVTAEWFAARVARVLASGPSRLRLGLFIFGFNACAIFIYMLSGLVPYLPAVTAFMTGTNVALASLIGRKHRSEIRMRVHLSPSARICMLLTFCLELPGFWYAMALGYTITTRIPDLVARSNLSSVQERVAAYGMVIVPVLAVSAFCEAHAIVSSLAGPSAEGEDTSAESDDAGET